MRSRIAIRLFISVRNKIVIDSIVIVIATAVIVIFIYLLIKTLLVRSQV
jgi:hypothetical protein